MQVEREPLEGQPSGGESGERVSNTWATCPRLWDNPGKPGLIPDTLGWSHGRQRKAPAVWDGPSAYQLAGWGNGPPRRRRVAGARAWPAALGLRHAPDSY